MSTLGKRLKKLLNDQLVTQQSFADALGISRQTVNNYITGKRDPDMSTLVGIYELFKDVDLHELILGESYRSTPSSIGPVAESVSIVEQGLLRLDPDTNEKELLDSIIPVLVRRRSKLGPVPYGYPPHARETPLAHEDDGNYGADACSLDGRPPTPWEKQVAEQQGKDWVLPDKDQDQPKE